VVNSCTGRIRFYPGQILFQCSVTLKMKKFFLVFKQNLLYFGSWPSPSVLLLDTTEESLAPSSVVPPLGLSTH